jgi:murein DD-endopeptidase MepM/ murein hydrolase activator NlpD
LKHGRRPAPVFLAVASLVLTSVGSGAEPASLRPGTTLRWPGEGIEWCAASAERTQPLDGACVFPIDLLQRAGPLELTRQRSGRLERVSVRVSRFDYPVQKLTLPSRMVDLSATDLERVRRENAEMARLWKARGPRRFSLPLEAPLDPLPEGGRFGHRRIINGSPRSPHGGADYSAPAGTPVRAAADGTVVMVADHFFGGNAVFVDHGDGLVTQYFHLSRVDVTQGQAIGRAAPLGAVGATGRATGPHLHFGVRFRGARVDPGALIGPPAAMPCLDPLGSLGCP